MRESDFPAFAELLDAVSGLLSRGAYVPSAGNSALWFRALRAHPLAVVRSSFDAHVRDPQRGRFVPTPADIIAQIDGLAADDGRPGAEEAWAMSLAARDEDETLVWTLEMAQSWSIARPVFALGDEVGARMAFREAYGRLVDEARRQHLPVAWTASLGHDRDRRALAIGSAVAAGRLPESELPALTAPRGPMALLEMATSGAPEHIRQRLRELRESLTMPRQAPPGRDALAKRETAQRQAAAAEKTRSYLGGSA